MSIAIASDLKHVLVILHKNNPKEEPEIRVWDIETQQLIHKYRGLSQEKYIIRTCFGGANQAFVLSGSEDSNIYIWHRHHGNLLEVLPGHSGSVNAVSWNPANPSQFASASDDRTIRLWNSPNPSPFFASSFSNGTESPSLSSSSSPLSTALSSLLSSSSSTAITQSSNGSWSWNCTPSLSNNHYGSHIRNRNIKLSTPFSSPSRSPPPSSPPSFTSSSDSSSSTSSSSQISF